jgi:hypothetical protein
MKLIYLERAKTYLTVSNITYIKLQVITNLNYKETNFHT